MPLGEANIDPTVWPKRPVWAHKIITWLKGFAQWSENICFSLRNNRCLRSSDSDICGVILLMCPTSLLAEVEIKKTQQKFSELIIHIIQRARVAGWLAHLAWCRVSRYRQTHLGPYHFWDQCRSSSLVPVPSPRINFVSCLRQRMKPLPQRRAGRLRVLWKLFRIEFD